MLEEATASADAGSTTLTSEQVDQIRAALTIPGCWNPRMRSEALKLLDDAGQQLSLLAMETA